MDRGAFTRLVWPKHAEHDIVMRVGDRLVHCAHCGCSLRAMQPPQSGYSHTAMYYECVGDDCRQVVWARAELVDRELQEFTRHRLSDPSPGAGWQRARFALIDAELAEARELWAWYADPQHRRQLARAFAWWRAPRMLPLMLFGHESLWWVRSGLQQLGDELAGQVVRLAERPVQATGRTLLSVLREARTAYKSAHSAWLMKDWPSPAARRRLEESQDRFWNLLLGTQWRDLGPAEPPVDDRALTRDWTQEHGMLSRRRELLRLAIDTDRLVLYGLPGTAPRIEAVPASPSTR
ncbi:hypothetical protein [Nonomuraea recticatena]|uniref:Uncharacterized protein n=1 Tax=Nonomuraea recticatena TaxID=46178 RepID=A0ABP6FWB3_9ACTN